MVVVAVAFCGCGFFVVAVVFGFCGYGLWVFLVVVIVVFVVVEFCCRRGYGFSVVAVAFGFCGLGFCGGRGCGVLWSK